MSSLPTHSSPASGRQERILAGTGCGHWDWNLSTGAVWFDTRFRDLLGQLPGDELPRTFLALQEQVHPEERPRLLPAVRRHLEQQQPFRFDCRLRRRDGTWLWTRLTGAAERDGTGRPVAMAGALEDISQARRQTEALHRSEEFLRRTLDSLTTAVGVLDARGEIVELNRAWREFPTTTGLAGLRFGFGEHYATSCRHAVGRCPQGLDLARGVEEVLSGERESFLLSYAATDDGQALYLQVRVLPCEVAGSRGAIVAHEDVTALQLASRQAAEASEFFGLVLDSVPSMLAYVNRELRVEWGNRAMGEWLGSPAATLRQRLLPEVLPAAYVAVLLPRIETVLAGRAVEFEVELPVGEEPRQFAVSHLPHRTGGAVAGFFLVVRDITVHRRLEGELRQAQKMEAVGQLTGGIAHDFNNLLAVVIGNLQLLERPLKDDPRLAGQVATALRAALRGAELTRRLLAFSRQQVLAPQVTLVNRVLRGMHELLVRSIGPAVSIEIALAPDAWAVSLDVGQFESCVLNLAINARDAMPAGGTLVLSTANRTCLPRTAAGRHLPGGDYLEVAVADTGAGMSPEVVKRAFEPFFTTKGIGRGTGLGLSMVYGFCAQSAGVVEIDSTPGYGTTVRMLFPRSTIAPVKALRGAPGAVEAPRGQECILLVEDDSDLRETTATGLRSLGYEVLPVSRAAAAIGLLRTGPAPALLLTDVMLPGGMLGPELARQARLLCPRLPVLFTTGLGDQIPNAELSAAIVIDKPFGLAELATRIRNLLDNAPVVSAAPRVVAMEQTA